MIVITGAPRTGTSMIMQTLKTLGVEVVGEKFSDVNMPENNPYGYYELPIAEITEGIQDLRYKGKAVKLFAQGLGKTKVDAIDKVIHCKRKVKESALSFMKVLKATPIGIKPTINNSKQIVKHNALFAETFAKHTKKPVFNVDFENFKSNKIEEIEKLCSFLGIEATAAQKSEAIKNIKDGK